MNSVDVADFDQFFDELWGFKPYRWQSELLRWVASEGRWPRRLDLPTGAGKTAVLDIAAFAMALDAERPAEQRTHPRRVALVVDRRIVVDQAHFRGQQLIEKLAGAVPGSVGEAVASRLRSLSAGAPIGDPVIGNATVLRGGIVRDESWATRPDVPAFLVGTVDQIGSRLLFQGYGLGRGALPMHAGLLGNDTLLLLDEVHLAVPFAETLDSLSSLRAEPGQRPWGVCELSATPRVDGPTEVFPEPSARSELLGDPAIAKRMNASKRARLIAPVKHPSDECKALRIASQQLADEAKTLTAELSNSAAVVGVIANRVDIARTVAEILDEKSPDLDVVLITGRMRAFDREKYLVSVVSQLTDASQREGMTRPLVVVGTQSLEAGADFDFDGLVTEVASLDALIQRFGRVDRTGRLTTSGKLPVSRIVANPLQLKDDPVYGDIAGETWSWLEDRAESGVVDMGVAGLSDVDVSTRDRLSQRRGFAPILTEVEIGSWSRTSLAQAHGPDVHTYLHGFRSGVPEVSIVWRADIELSAEDSDSDSGDLAAADRLRAAPIRANETLAVPYRAARTWLERGSAVSISDVEGADPEETEAKAAPQRPFMVRQEGQWTKGKSVRPGDTIVVPASYGGIGRFGTWDGSPTGDIRDVAEVGAARKAVARFEEPIFEQLERWDDLTPPASAILNVARPWMEVAERRNLLKLARDMVRTDADDRDIGRVIAEILPPEASGFVVPFTASNDARKLEGFVIRSNTSEFLVEVEDVDDDRSFSVINPEPVRLVDHLAGVGQWAESLARNCGLATEMVSDLRLAGRLHDLGKADPRFQSWLRGGGPFVGEVWAKSKPQHSSVATRRKARKQSGYPKGMRHELLSVEMLTDKPEVASKAHDWELVLHLVAAHHGHCRPFAPVQLDPAPLDVAFPFDGVSYFGSTGHRLDDFGSEIASRFTRLTKRYGAYQLAYFEAVLRLADHRRSESEQHLGKESDGPSNV